MREYNHSYNFFAGMSDDAVARYQKDAITGHRPTWKMGMVGGSAADKRGSSRRFEAGGADDPFGLFRELGAAARGQAERRGRAAHGAQRRAQGAACAGARDRRRRAAEIKARFKELVKRHHPDANGGDRGTEDKLREIIEAYNYLKSVGFC